MNLKNYRKNIKSQFGEDGIIEEIFNRIKPKSKICIEFGAWDGEHCSNVWNLWTNNDWSGILIEADPKKFVELKEKTKAFSKLFLVNRFVEPEGKNSVDSIVSELNITDQIDLLSIDIDGNDYYILNGLIKVKPRVIIIEYNPTIPPDFAVIQKKDEYFGASALAILNLAKSKGYKLAAITDTNLILVSNDDFQALGIEEVDLQQEFPRNHLIYVITSYDGKAYLTDKLPYIWEIPTLPDIINSDLEKHTFLKRVFHKFIKFKKEAKPEIISEHNIIPVRLFKD